MAGTAHRLPVRPVPEQLFISLVRLYMVDRGGRHCAALLLTLNAQWMRSQVHLPFTAPPRGIIQVLPGFVPAGADLGGFLFCVRLAVRSLDQFRAAGYCAWFPWFQWHIEPFIHLSMDYPTCPVSCPKIPLRRSVKSNQEAAKII